MNEIVQKENKILREIAKEVPLESIKSRKIETILRRMVKALDNEEDGIAIAAPQIGESLRIFVVSKRIFEIMQAEQERRVSSKDPASKKPKVDLEDMVFINPEILKTSKKKSLMEEGCLSVRWLYGKVERPDKILVKAFSQDGKLFTLGGSGLLAQVFQHEIDHLNGVLFIDKAVGLKEMPPNKENPKS